MSILSIFDLGIHKFHHSGEASWLIEPLDERVSIYLKKCIRNGCKKPKDLKHRGREYVKEHIFHGEQHPSYLRRRFFPSRKKIKNLIYSVKSELRHSKIDQENLEHLIKEWENDASIHLKTK